MKILALILARRGSKRLVDKNIRNMCGKPLILWSIETAKKIKLISDILVSTDDSRVASICAEAGVPIPWLRPRILASDSASSVDVALHALDWYEAEKGGVDGILLLQPTSPFRSVGSIIRGIELFEESKFKPVVGVSPSRDHPMWAMKIEGNYLMPFMDNQNAIKMRSQELPPAYIINGSFYLIKPEELRKNKSFLNQASVPLVIESALEAVDIDTEDDFIFAELLYKQRKSNQIKRV